ncbi:esterase E4-like [Diprion similis]|uniref:esterase E4-like n=1 Tax=Diprion similis TaxID=362088 RepID=UPI001EF8F9F2|nr:esterase E4-like [Diprion similis]
MTSSSGAVCLCFSLLLSIFFSISYGYFDGTTEPEVTISEGTLRGKIATTSHGRKVAAFLGIPYAQPPIGNKRFADPVPAGGWEGIRNATADGNRCPQPNMADLITVIGDEDCLHLNVFTPQIRDGRNSSLLPVMVYVFGGRFTFGSANSTAYSPIYLLNQDVVLVTFSYRLGALGFLSTGDKVASGNWGLKDQVLALKWVQRNIRHFYGDPDRVTIFGHSSGSACVHLLTLSKLTIGLFHKFIMQSGSGLSPWAYRPRAAYAKRAYELGNYVGCYNDTSDALITCLRKKNFRDILGVFTRFYVWHYEPFTTWACTDEPDIEGAFLTNSPANILRAGQIRDLPCIIGVVGNEAIGSTADLYENEELFEEFVENFDYLLPILMYWSYLPDSGAAWAKAAKSYYFNDIEKMNRKEFLNNLTVLISDSSFNYPLYSALLHQFAVAANPQYFYAFHYRGTWSNTYLYSRISLDYGVAHADELNYIFPHVDYNLVSALNKTMNEKDRQMMEIMVQLWTSFAIHGKPSSPFFCGNSTWEPYSEKDNYLQIGNKAEITLEMKNVFLRERMQFWANLERSTTEAETIVTIN